MFKSLMDWFEVFRWSVFRNFHNEIYLVSKNDLNLVWLIPGALIFFVVIGIKISGLLGGKKGWSLNITRVIGFFISTSAALGLFGLLLWGYSAWLISEVSWDKSRHFQMWDVWLFSQANNIGMGLGGGFLVGLMFVFLIGRYVEPWYSKVLSKGTIESGQLGVSDVEEVAKGLPENKVFDPTKYFSKGVKRNSMFLGLDEKKKPVFIPREEWKRSNVQIIGPTQRGKGVQAGVILSQSVMYGDGVVVLDPKGDKWGPCVLREACQKAGKKFVYIDLNKSFGPQFNPLAGADSDAIQEMLEAGFEMSDKGADSDFYRAYEREAARLLAESCAEGETTLAQLSDCAGEIIDSELEKDVRKFLLNLADVSRLKSIQTLGGPKLSDLIEDGGVVWIVGSEDVIPVVRLQRMIAYRVIQLLRSRKDKSRYVSVFMDEFKFLISGPTFRSLGTIIGKGGANMLIAHQSIGDLEDVPKDLNENAVKRAVIDNCHLRWIYRAGDGETADWVVNLEGTKVRDKERRLVERNDQLAEIGSDERMIDKEEVSYLHRNQILHLPNSCAVLTGLGVAKFAFTSPVRVNLEKIKPGIVTGIERKPIDDLITDPKTDQGNVGDELL